MVVNDYVFLKERALQSELSSLFKSAGAGGVKEEQVHCVFPSLDRVSVNKSSWNLAIEIAAGRMEVDAAGVGAGSARTQNEPRSFICKSI